MQNAKYLSVRMITSSKKGGTEMNRIVRTAFPVALSVWAGLADAQSTTTPTEIVQTETRTDLAPILGLALRPVAQLQTDRNYRSDIPFQQRSVRSYFQNALSLWSIPEPFLR
jgi:hypothetical protein